MFGAYTVSLGAWLRCKRSPVPLRAGGVMPRGVEEALTAWRDVVRKRLTAEYMVDRIDALKEAEQRRKNAAPSSEPFHQAVRDEKAIAAEIWAAQSAERRANSVRGPLVYQHVNPQQGLDHQISPKRILAKGRRPAWRTVCGSCDKFVMMVPEVGARL
jgi:hypothetical protein